MTTPHNETVPAADATGAAIRRVDGQGEEVAFATLIDAMREDPRAGNLDLRIVDEHDRALAEVDGRLMVQVGGPRGHIEHCWLDALSKVVDRAEGEWRVIRVRPEWRFTVAGLERLAIENDRARSLRRVA